LVFGPQSLFVLLLLVAAFAGLCYVLAKRGHLVLRVGAAGMAFVVSSVFGMALVNKFYDYYQTWGDLINDLSGKQPGEATLPPSGGKDLAVGGDRAKNGLLVSTLLDGPRSRIGRDGLVYLPPEYFQAEYRTAKFPVLELMHGSPGKPADWQTGLHLVETYRKLLGKKQVKPVIFVIPDINGLRGGGTGSQCLDLPGSTQDDTYLSTDVPNDVIAQFRAEPVGARWGIAGYSEGGFCAANLALRHPGVYNVAASMSGYFQPLPERGVDPFHGDAAARLANDPVWLATTTLPGAKVPQFWLMAGSSDRGDVESAKLFQSVLAKHGKVSLVLIPRARHTFAAWNPALPKMLMWATARI
jgi:enterochelin esterase-like enzyme